MTLFRRLWFDARPWKLLQSVNKPSAKDSLIYFDAEVRTHFLFAVGIVAALGVECALCCNQELDGNHHLDMSASARVEIPEEKPVAGR